MASTGAWWELVPWPLAPWEIDLIEHQAKRHGLDPLDYIAWLAEQAASDG